MCLLVERRTSRHAPVRYWKSILTGIAHAFVLVRTHLTRWRPPCVFADSVAVKHAAALAKAEAFYESGLHYGGPCRRSRARRAAQDIRFRRAFLVVARDLGVRLVTEDAKLRKGGTSAHSIACRSVCERLDADVSPLKLAALRDLKEGSSTLERRTPVARLFHSMTGRPAPMRADRRPS